MIRDIVNKNENVDAGTYEMKKLKEVVPQCFNEDNTFDMEKFQSLLKGKINIRNEGYGLHFLGKSYARMLASLDTETVITPNEEHNAKDENKDSENIYITGDNLDALKHLLKSYIRKIKCIYIDPPYNTGKDDFAYKDNFNFTVDELTERLSINEDEAQRVLALTKKGSASHSAWLTFMYSRLLLARDLLTDDGVIFISIDDNEDVGLKLLCDEIFGEYNFLGKVIHKTATDNNPGQIKIEHEYMLFYCKDKDKQNNWIANNDKADKIQKKYLELKNKYKNDIKAIQKDLREWIKKHKKELKQVYHYDNVDEKGVFHDADIQNTKIGGYDYEIIHPITKKPVKKPEKGYRYSYDTIKIMIENNDILFGKDENTLIKPKKRLEDAKMLLRSVLYEDGRSSSNKVDDLIGRNVFPNPKSDTILKYILDFITNKESIILDFFAGSSTTADAVMQLNIRDNGNRKFIMVQLAEEIAENKPAYKAGYRTIDEIGRERIVRAAKKIKEDNPDTAVDLGFKHYVLNEVDDNTFDTLEQFKPEETLISDNHVLNMFGAKTVLTTWLVYDGYGFNADVNVVKFGNYTAYHCQKHLYFIYDDFDDDAMQALIEKYDGDGNFNPENLIVFGYSFSWTQMQMLKVNLHRLKVTDRNIAVNIDIRY